MPTSDDALAWARRGFRVFPCLENGKEPAIGHFPELATVDEQQIVNWWRGRDYNIGLAMGQGILAIDLDTKHDTATQSAVEAFELYGGDWSTLVNRTATGGYHVFYKHDPAITYRNEIGLFPGVDVRATGGYVVAPPSFVVDIGQGVFGGYDIHHDGSVADLPPTIAGFLRNPGPRQRDNGVGADTAASIPLYTEYLRSVAPPAIEGQGGDKQTYDVACMGVRDYGLTTITTFRLMLEHYNPRCVPPWDADELHRKIENADMYAIGTTGSRDPETILGGLTFNFVEPPPPPPTPVASRARRLLDETTIPITQWLVPHILLRGETTVASGPPGAGKSSWTLALAVHGAAGMSFGPYEIDKPFATMIYNREDGIEYSSGRASVTCQLNGFSYRDVSQRLLLADRDTKPLVLCEREGGKIRMPDETIRFLAGVMEEQPDTALMVFDPYVFMLRNIDENDNNQQSECMDWINHMAKTFNVAVLIGHHTPKGLLSSRTFKPDSLDVARGGGAIVSSARIALNLLPQTDADSEIQGDRDDVFSVRIAKSNLGPKGKASWWERRIMTAPNGVKYASPVPANFNDLVSSHWRTWIDAIGDYMLANAINEFRVSDAGPMLCNLDPDDSRSAKSIQNALRDYVFKRGQKAHPYVDNNGHRYTVILNTNEDDGSPIRRGHFFTLVPLHVSLPLPPVVLPPLQQQG